MLRSDRILRSRTTSCFPKGSYRSALFFIVSISFCFVYFRCGYHSTHLRIRMASSLPPVFSLLVTLQLTDESTKSQFLKDITPVAEHCRNHEPDTLSYQVLESDKDPLQVLILERYREKDHAYLQVHKSSAPFLQFRAKLQAMQEDGKVSISGHSYLDHSSSGGYVQQ